MTKGLFISFEGGEGSGKSKQIELLSLYLASKSISYIVGREPGGTPFSEALRKILKDWRLDRGVRSEILTFSASRAEYVDEFIIPNLEKYSVVISDRFFDSTTIYQGYMRGYNNLDDIQTIHRISTGGIIPDITFLLDGDPRILLKRLESRSKEYAHKDRFDDMALEKHDKIRHSYLEIAKLEPQRFRIINVEQNPESVHKEILTHLNF